MPKACEKPDSEYIYKKAIKDGVLKADLGVVIYDEDEGDNE